MLPELLAIAHGFATGDRFLNSLVGDFSAADWQVRDPAGHSPRWLVGHLAATRSRVLALTGLALEPAPWEKAFARGTAAAEIPEDLDMAEVVRAFHATQPLLAARWDILGAAELAAPLGRTLPNGSDTVGGALEFLAWHEAYHLGQLGLMRRLAGKPGLA